MSGHGHAESADGGTLAVIVVGALLVPALAYLGAAARERRGGRGWPWHRCATWLVGLGATGVALTGPLADAAHHDFRLHMLAHLLVGMLAPLLLVVSAPVTLALRTIDVVPARRLTRLLRSRVLRVVSHPISALLLTAGTLWLLYTTPLYGVMTGSTAGHLLVMLHFLASGALFAAAIAPVDPAPHRSSIPVRGLALLTSVASHGILAKHLAVSPPPGVDRAEALAGGELMYIGGDAVELVLIAMLAAQWYRATRPREGVDADAARRVSPRRRAWGSASGWATRWAAGSR